MTNSTKLINTLNLLRDPAIIAVSGFGGAGKSTFANALSMEMNIPIIEVDSFFKGFHITNYSKWECMDFTRLEKDVCLPFSKGTKQIMYQEFDWGNDSPGDMKIIRHHGKIIIEGIGLFRPELLNYFSYMIWIDCPIEEAIRRGKQRELARDNTSQDQYWDGIWRRNDEECWSAFKPEKIADEIIKT